MKRLSFIITCCLLLLQTVAQAEEEQVTIPDLSASEILDLHTVQELALRGNPDIVAAQARVKQAHERVNQAVAAWWPAIDLSAAAARQRLSDSDYATNQALYGATDQTIDDFKLGVVATWLLFDGFYRNFNEEQARYDEESNMAGLTNAKRLLVISVAEAFLNAQLAQTNVDIARADKAFYTRQLEDARNRYDVGAGAWGDVLNIKVQLNSAETDLLVNQRQYEAAGYGLAALIGLQYGVLPASTRLEALDRTFTAEKFNEDINKLIQNALDLRPDVQQFELTVQQAAAGEGIAKAPFYPTVQLAGAVTGERREDAGFTDEDFGNSVSVNFAWNIFSGGEDKARLAEAKEAKREAQYSLFNLRNRVAAEIRQDIALLEAAQEQVRLQRNTVGLVEENRDLAKNEYEAGEASLVRLNEAQRDLTATYGRLAQALVGYHRAWQRLNSSTGRNLQGFISEEQK